ncbi:hypothetical protein LZ32DRAFT_309871 [Colletotrichum eremochloae]|nr:hypothetical protein LZ32DRAFT_309871 [Colletotrichum eremochloae]
MAHDCGGRGWWWFDLMCGRTSRVTLEVFFFLSAVAQTKLASTIPPAVASRRSLEREQNAGGGGKMGPRKPGARKMFLVSHREKSDVREREGEGITSRGCLTWSCLRRVSLDCGTCLAVSERGAEDDQPL